MANIQNLRKGFVAVVIVTAAMLTTVTMASAQNNGVRQEGQGKYAQLTAQWWQWILEAAIADPLRRPAH